MPEVSFNNNTTVSFQNFAAEVAEVALTREASKQLTLLNDSYEAAPLQVKARVTSLIDPKNLPKRPPPRAAPTAALKKEATQDPSPGTTATKGVIRNFMDKLGLVRLPDKNVSLGLASIRDLLRGVHPDEPPIQGGKPLEKLFGAIQPYIKHNEANIRFASANKEAFSRYAEQIRESDPELYQELTALDFANTADSPNKHLGTYSIGLGDLRGAIDKGDAKKLKEKAASLSGSEAQFQRNLELFAKVCADPRFQELCEDKEEAVRIGKQCAEIAEQAKDSSALFAEVSDSIESAPETWIEEIQVKPAPKRETRASEKQSTPQKKTTRKTLPDRVKEVFSRIVIGAHRGVTSFVNRPPAEISKPEITNKAPVQWAKVTPRIRLDQAKHENLTPIQQKILGHAELNAAFREHENKQASLAKLRAIGIPEEELEATFEKLCGFITSSKPTLNFFGNDMERLERLSKKGGLEKMWDAPQGTFGTALVNKRDSVERGMYGFGQNPYDVEGGSEERPTYMGLNTGGAVKGAAPRYGGSYFVGKSSIMDKSTLAGGDTFNNTFEASGYKIGTKHNPEAVIANMDKEAIRKMLRFADGGEPHELADNQYVELQTFGVNWDDIEELVLDRSEVGVGSEEEKKWEAFAKEKSISLKFYDSKAYSRDAITDLAKANKKHAPLSKEEDLPRSLEIEKVREAEKAKLAALDKEVAKGTIANFMEQLGLVRIPEKNVSLGIGSIKSLQRELAPGGEKITGDKPLERLFSSLQPYLEHNAANDKFAQENDDTFKRFAELVKESDLLLYKELTRQDLQTLTANPIGHTRTYGMVLGEIRKGIDRGDLVKLKAAAAELADMETSFRFRTELLAKVCSDPRFLKLCKGKKEAKRIGAQCEEVARHAKVTSALFQQASVSVQTHPHGVCCITPHTVNLARSSQSKS